MQGKEIHYFDSMASSGMRYLQALKRWLTDEWSNKKNGTIDIQQWRLVPCTSVKCSQQGNGYDCGVFAIMNADFLSDDLDILLFNQSHIPMFRQKICLYISNGILPYGVI